MLDALAPHVRLATMADRPAILAMLVEAWDENGVMEVDWDKVKAHIDLWLTQKEGFILLIDGDDGEIAASFCAIVEEWWYTKTWSITERWNYVRAPYRHSHYAADLIDVALRISDRWNLALSMGITSTIRLKAKIRLYRRKMTMAGAVFIHGLERCPGPLGLKAKGNGADG